MSLDSVQPFILDADETATLPERSPAILELENKRSLDKRRNQYLA
jgi:hypothetical protein